ncbi:MAG: hypothetical protein O6703_11830, partial [Gammaproteobacteria bacterium]|nr:hypothetical protein [Gammaproteobacteria bacterium]
KYPIYGQEITYSTKNRHVLRQMATKSLVIVFGLLLALPLVAQETIELSKEVVETRLQTLRAGSGDVGKSMLAAYESIHSWLKQAASHDQDTAENE